MAKQQTILITGATGNVGGGAALALAKRGFPELGMLQVAG